VRLDLRAVVLERQEGASLPQLRAAVHSVLLQQVLEEDSELLAHRHFLDLEEQLRDSEVELLLPSVVCHPLAHPEDEKVNFIFTMEHVIGFLT
jgi:hypothetical protein